MARPPGAPGAGDGESIRVPNVLGAAALPEAAKVVVDKSDSTVSLVDASGRKYAQFPATTVVTPWKHDGVSSGPQNTCAS